MPQEPALPRTVVLVDAAEFAEVVEFIREIRPIVRDLERLKGSSHLLRLLAGGNGAK